MDEIKEKIEFIRETLQAYDDGVISDLSALIAIQICTSKNTPSDKCMEWAKANVLKHEKTS